MGRSHVDRPTQLLDRLSNATNPVTLNSDQLSDLLDYIERLEITIDEMHAERVELAAQV